MNTIDISGQGPLRPAASVLPFSSEPLSEALAVSAAKHFAIFEATRRGLWLVIPFDRHSPYHFLVDGHPLWARVRALVAWEPAADGRYAFKIKAQDKPHAYPTAVYALVALDIPAITWVRGSDLPKSVFRISRDEIVDTDKVNLAFDLCLGHMVWRADGTLVRTERG